MGLWSFFSLWSLSVGTSLDFCGICLELANDVYVIHEAAWQDGGGETVSF